MVFSQLVSIFSTFYLYGLSTNPLKMNVEGIGGWIFGRILFAILVFQILGLAPPWNAPFASTAQLLAIAATPGSIELLALTWRILLDGGSV